SEFPSAAKGRSLPWIGALAATALAFVATGVLMRTRVPGSAATSAAATKKLSVEAHAVAPHTAPALVSPPPKELPVPEPVVPAVEKRDAEPDPPLPVKREPALSTARAAKRQVKAHESPKVAASQPPALASPPASAKRKATEAWDPESFGPRR